MKLLSKVEERLAPAVERTERLIRDWEWTWTNSVIVSLLIAFLVLLNMGIVPSWMLYFAQQKLRWTGSWNPINIGPIHVHIAQVLVRDAVATGYLGTWFVIILIAASQLQNIRRKLRGATSDSKPTGGYR